MVKTPVEVDPEELRAFLRAEIEKSPPPTELSSYDTVKALLPEITELLKRRHSRAEVVEMLASKGVKLGLGSFNTYYAKAKREASAEAGEPARAARKKTVKPDVNANETRTQRDSETKRAKPSELAGVSKTTPGAGGSKLGHKLNDDDV